MGKGSRDFERYPEEARKLDSAHCFIVLYGLEFRLRTLSVAGQCVCVLRSPLSDVLCDMFNTVIQPVPEVI